jgi:hypothetical protein
MSAKIKGRAPLRSAPSRPAKKFVVHLETTGTPCPCLRCWPPCYKAMGHIEAERAAEEAARGHREMIADDLGHFPSPPPPLCKDCRFCRRDWSGWRFAQCFRESRHSLVDGTTEVRAAGYASNERGDYQYIDVCGPAGRYFQPLVQPPNLLQRIADWWAR